MSARRDGALRSVDDPEAIHVAVSSATRRCGFLTIAADDGALGHNRIMEEWATIRSEASLRNTRFTDSIRADADSPAES